MRRYYRERYHLQVCKFSGYYYYVDKYCPDKETSWYKPLLAFPGDILPAKAVEYDPEDYMMGEKYSRRSFTTGPVIFMLLLFWLYSTTNLFYFGCVGQFLKISGLSKYSTVRSHQPAFLIEKCVDIVFLYFIVIIKRSLSQPLERPSHFKLRGNRLWERVYRDNSGLDGRQQSQSVEHWRVPLDANCNLPEQLGARNKMHARSCG